METIEMNKTFGALAALALAATVGGAGVAQTPAHAGSDRPGRGAAAQPISQADFVQRRVERLRAADLNGDGSVMADEMRTARQAAGTQRRIALFDRLDADKDGQISRAEFEARPERGQRARGGERAGRPHHARRMGGDRRAEGRFPIMIADAERKAVEAFSRLDANSDGVITPDERQAARAQVREKRQERRAERMARRGAPASPSAPASE